VASRDTGAVLRFNPTTGAFLDTFVSSGSGGLVQTEELLFGPDGNLYVTEFSGNRVLRYSGATGDFLGVFATSESVAATRGMAFGADGNLYVSGNASDNVVRFDGRTGAFLGVFASGISGANGIAFGLDGNLYVASEFGNVIVRVDGTTGSFIDNFASVTGPIGILFDVTSPPSIQKPPQTQTAEAGSTVDWSVEANGARPIYYLWYFNTTNLIACSTNDDLEMTNVQFSQTGAYTVAVTNVVGAVTSAPALLNVIPTVERRWVPGIKVTGRPGDKLTLDYADFRRPAPSWTTLGSVSLTSTSQYYFDLTIPVPAQRFYRAWLTTMPGMAPSLDLSIVPAITLVGSTANSVRVDAINRFGPTNAWFGLATVTLTNTTQLYFDTSAIGQPPRLWRIVPVP
jgi:hypothetical protein